jgi:hypothetical protein
MARVEYGGGITNVKGKIGGWVFQKSNRNNIIRSKGSPKKIYTSRQSVAHQSLQAWLYQWQLISLLDKIAWNDFAAINDRIDVFGNNRKLTGLNWFISINSFLSGLSVAMVTTPPLYVVPGAIPTYSLILDDTSITIDFNGATVFSDYGFAVYASNISQSASVKNYNSMRLLGFFVPDTYNTIDVTTLWNAAWLLDYSSFSFVSNFNISIVLVPIHATSGITGAGYFNVAEFSV